MGGNFVGNRQLFYHYLDQKFMITGQETWDFARRKFPELLTLEIGNPDNINEDYRFRIVVFGQTGCGKTALIDQLRYGSMKNSEHMSLNQFQLGENKLDVFEVGEHNHPEPEVMQPEMLHMGIFIQDSTRPEGLPELLD